MLGARAETALSYLASDAMKAARALKRLALASDPDGLDDSIGLSEGPSAQVPRKGGVSKAALRGPGMLLLGAELASLGLELGEEVAAKEDVRSAISAANASIGLDEDTGAVPSPTKQKRGRGSVLLAGDSMGGAMVDSLGEEIDLDEQIDRAAAGADNNKQHNFITSLHRPNVHICDFGAAGSTLRGPLDVDDAQHGTAKQSKERRGSVVASQVVGFGDNLDADDGVGL